MEKGLVIIAWLYLLLVSNLLQLLLMKKKKDFYSNKNGNQDN